MKRIIALSVMLFPAASYAAITHDTTLPDSITWGICFTLLMYIMAYRFTAGPAALIGSTALGYWGFQLWEIFLHKPVNMPKEVYDVQLIAIILMTVIAFVSFLKFCTRRNVF